MVTFQAVNIDEEDPADETVPEVSEPVVTPNPGQGQPTAMNPPTTTGSETSRATMHSLSAGEHVLAFHLAAEQRSDNQVEIAVHHVGSWYDWRYDEFSMTQDNLQTMLNNFNNLVVHPNAPINRQVPLQAGHGFLGEPPAAGWMLSGEIRDGVLYGMFEVNDESMRRLRSGEYAFVSPHYTMDYLEQRIVDGERTAYGPTILHVALTNSPVLAELPQIALSRTPSFMDLGVYQPVEARVPNDNGGGTATPVADPPTTQQDPVTDPAPSPAAAPASQPAATSLAQQPQIPAGFTMVRETEFNDLQNSVRTLQQQNEENNRRLHEGQVETICSEAASRGVPPAVLSLARSIMNVANPRAAATISLSTEGQDDRSVNVFEAMRELLNVMPTISLGIQTPSGNNQRPGASTLTLEEAEAKGAEMWKSAGITAAVRE